MRDFGPRLAFFHIHIICSPCIRKPTSTCQMGHPLNDPTRLVGLQIRDVTSVEFPWSDVRSRLSFMRGTWFSVVFPPTVRWVRNVRTPFDLSQAFRVPQVFQFLFQVTEPLLAVERPIETSLETSELALSPMDQSSSCRSASGHRDGSLSRPCGLVGSRRCRIQRLRKR